MCDKLAQLPVDTQVELYYIPPPMTIATKTIKVTSDDHRRLKLMAAKTGEHVYQVIARLIKTAMNGTKKERK